MMAAILNSQMNDLESIYIIWLDASVHQCQENINAQEQIRSISNHLKVFDNIQDCEKYINNACETDRILLIVSGQFGQKILPRIHQCRQIFSIYVYCMYKEKNELWAKPFKKVINVITNLNDLLKHIQEDHLKRNQNRVDEPSPINLSSLNNIADKSTKEMNGEFLYSKLLIDCLLRMSPNGKDRNELIVLCKSFYKNNPKELAIVSDFEAHYSGKTVLWWYTRESFVYRLLNKALRVQNIDLLFLFRFFLRDMETELKLSQSTASIRVYRGQLMSMDEINRLKKVIGEFISMSSFFSTTLNRQQALKFLDEYSYSHHLQKVLFEVDANPHSNISKPFGNITSKSCYSNEQEVLFMLGSIFRLESVKQESNGTWIIHIILANDNDKDLKTLFDAIRNEYSAVNEETSLLTFGNILYLMGKYDLAEKYFLRLLSELPSDHSDVSKCYHSLGVTALIKEDCDSSLSWQGQSMKCLTSNDPRLADSYNCIGCIYQRKGNYKSALEFYQKALNIWKLRFGEEYYQIADCLNNMGCLYEKEDDYSNALECHLKALSIRKKLLPKYHSDIGASYNNIGNIYFSLAQYDLALENYKQSYEIKLKSLPPQHSSIASTLENIGLVYEQREQFENALEYYEKAAVIWRETFSSQHTHVIEIAEHIQRVLSKQDSEILITRL